MSLTLIANTPFVSGGIQTYTYTIPTTGLYTVRFQVLDTPASSLSVLVKNGVTTVYTAPTLGVAQSAMQFTKELLCTAADVITVVMASAAAVDNKPNNIKCMCSIGAGN